LNEPNSIDGIEEKVQKEIGSGRKALVILIHWQKTHKMTSTIHLGSNNNRTVRHATVTRGQSNMSCKLMSVLYVSKRANTTHQGKVIKHQSHITILYYTRLDLFTLQDTIQDEVLILYTLCTQEVSRHTEFQIEK